MSNGDNKARAADALLREYEAISSSISTYRTFEVQLLGFAIVIYTAILTGLATKLGGDQSPNIAGIVTTAIA